MQYTGYSFDFIAALAGGLAVGITVLYLLKLRKRRVQVPFSPLWGRVLQEHTQQSDLWRRLRRLLSWLLQLLVLCALGWALADPHPADEVIDGRHIVLLVDSSASMASTDVSGGADRLDVAKQKAREILETVGAEDRVMLVNFNKQLQPLSPFVSEVSILEQPLRDIEIAATGTRFEEALEFAADSLRDKKLGELVLLSDGAGVDMSQLQELDFGQATTVRHIKIGERDANLAITAFSVRRYLANKLDYELFVEVESDFDRPITAELQLYADGKLVDAKDIELEPKGKLQEFYPAQAVSGERLEARVKVTSLDARDVFPIDDRAYALLPKLERAKVQLVTDGNLYLEGTLLLNANLTMERVSPDDYQPGGDFDVTFFDRAVPDSLPDAGNFVFVDPRGDASPWEVSGYIQDPIITSYRKSHPLMRWIGMRDVNIGVGTKFKLARGDQVVASAFGTPMVVAREEGARKMVLLAFDIRNSDLPLRVAFPVLMINLMDYFQLDEGSLIQKYATGTTWSVGVDAVTGEATVTRPDGTSIAVPIYNGRAIVYGEHTGFYELEVDGSTQTLAANLLEPKESRIGPKDLKLPEREVVPSTDQLLFDRQELWIWALLAVLGVLLLEWWTYNRRITV
ncbi:MAG: VWA domain-containing protein [Myxococcota bacterium]